MSGLYRIAYRLKAMPSFAQGTNKRTDEFKWKTASSGRSN
jgi:hypothetical protein